MAPATPARLRQSLPDMMFSITVSAGNRRIVWKVRAMPAAAMACGRLPTRLLLSNTTEPLSGL